MPTAMSYAIDTILRLCEENTRLRMLIGGKPSGEVENIKMEIGEKVCECPTLEEVERLKESADLIAESQQKQIDLLLEDKRERMEDRERLVKELEKEKEDREEAHRVWTEHREKLLKEIKQYQTQLSQLADTLLETKVQLKNAEEKVERAVGGNVGRPKKSVCSPCISDPTP